MNRVTTLALTGLLAIGAACSSSPSNSTGTIEPPSTTTTTAKKSEARKLYNQFIKKYQPVIDELALATGEDNTTETFEEYVASTEACAPMTDEQRGMVTIFLGSVLTKHGFSVAEFLADTERLRQALVAEGFCN